MPSTVYSALRDEILSGALSPGTPLAENGLAARFGTSRTPIREALHQLVVEQLAVRTPRGVVVKDTSPEEILDIYEVRITLEGAAARSAAARHTAFDLMKLRGAQAQMRRLESDEGRDRAEANRVFHEELWAASHSSTLVDVLGRLNVHLIRYPTSTLTQGNRWQEALDEHDALLAAIERGDAPEAERIAIEHMTHARDVRLQMYTDAALRPHDGTPEAG